MIHKIRVVDVVEEEGERFALVELNLTEGHLQTSIPAEQLIKAGQACENHEIAKAHDAAASLDMAKLADDMLESMNKLACMGNLKGGQNE